MSDVSNADDIIDSRDVIERIEELEAIEEPNDEEKEELAALLALAEEGEGLADWQYGETLIRNSYFETYAEELAEDIGAIGKDTQWPLSFIDWEAAANALKQDYTAIEFDGVTYWGRS
jgi:antirestriction protein